MTARATDKFVRDVPHSVLPGHRVIQTSETTRVGSPHVHSQAAGGQSKVELVREGDVVKAIDVTCSCGETMRIWCSYEAE